MDIVATTKYVRLSPRKARDLARELKGRPVPFALALLGLSERRAAYWLAKTLRSAIGNATNNRNLDPDRLIVKEAIIEEGPRLKRWMPVARGAAHPIRHRFSHVRVVLTEADTTK